MDAPLGDVQRMDHVDELGETHEWSVLCGQRASTKYVVPLYLYLTNCRFSRWAFSGNRTCPRRHADMEADSGGERQRDIYLLDLRALLSLYAPLCFSETADSWNWTPKKPEDLSCSILTLSSHAIITRLDCMSRDADLTMPSMKEGGRSCCIRSRSRESEH